MTNTHQTEDKPVEPASPDTAGKSELDEENHIHIIPGLGKVHDVGLTLLKKRDPRAYEKMMNWD